MSFGCWNGFFWVELDGGSNGFEFRSSSERSSNGFWLAEYTRQLDGIRTIKGSFYSHISGLVASSLKVLQVS